VGTQELMMRRFTTFSLLFAFDKQMQNYIIVRNNNNNNNNLATKNKFKIKIKIEMKVNFFF
jgi:hypothetical protein